MPCVGLTVQWGECDALCRADSAMEGNVMPCVGLTVQWRGM